MLFPFLFGGTFIEGLPVIADVVKNIRFPFLFGGTFIEGTEESEAQRQRRDFPSFSEGLSLRVQQ